MISERIVSVLENYPAMVGVVKHVRPIVLDQTDELPSITYQVETNPTHTWSGQSKFTKSLVEFNTYSQDFVQANNIALDINHALLTMLGNDSGLTVFKVIYDRKIEGFDSKTGDYSVNQQFTIHYQED